MSSVVGAVSVMSTKLQHKFLTFFDSIIRFLFYQCQELPFTIFELSKISQKKLGNENVRSPPVYWYVWSRLTTVYHQKPLARTSRYTHSKTIFVFPFSLLRTLQPHRSSLRTTSGKYKFSTICGTTTWNW